MGEIYCYTRKGRKIAKEHIERDQETYTVIGLTVPVLDVPLVWDVIEGASCGIKYRRFFTRKLADIAALVGPEKTIFVDNLNYHVSGDFADSVRGCCSALGWHYKELPVYSPELNPIEHVWAWMKGQLRHLPYSYPIPQAIVEVLSRLERHHTYTFYKQSGWIN